MFDCSSEKGVLFTETEAESSVDPISENSTREASNSTINMAFDRHLRIDSQDGYVILFELTF